MSHRSDAARKSQKLSTEGSWVASFPLDKLPQSVPPENQLGLEKIAV